MKKPVAIIGSAGRVPASWRLSTTDLFNKTGRNTGNLAFKYALDRLIVGERRHIGFQFNPAEVRETCRLICLPAANWLYSKFDFGDLANRLEAAGLPLLVVGLGAQAGRNPDEVKLTAGTERLLRVFAERCKRVVVRGRHTAAVMERYGVHNFDPIGCPTNFINGEPGLGAGILKRFQEKGFSRIAFAPTFYRANEHWEFALYKEISGRLSEVVCQEPEAAIAFARGERGPEVQKWLSEGGGFVTKLKLPAERGRLADLCRAYSCAEAWMESYLRANAVVGSRIHGASLGWQAGRPSCVIGHDLRTAELAESMGLPLIHATELKDNKGRVAELFAERLVPAAEAYDARRSGLAKRLLDVFAEDGVEGNAELKKLAAREEAPRAAAA